jgi:hypothetical protein
MKKKVKRRRTMMKMNDLVDDHVEIVVEEILVLANDLILETNVWNPSSLTFVEKLVKTSLMPTTKNSTRSMTIVIDWLVDGEESVIDLTLE